MKMLRALIEILRICSVLLLQFGIFEVALLINATASRYIYLNCVGDQVK